MVAGASFGTALFASLAVGSAFGSLLASALLGLYFGKAWAKTGFSLDKFVPAGVMALGSALTAVLSWKPAVLSVAA